MKEMLDNLFSWKRKGNGLSYAALPAVLAVVFLRQYGYAEAVVLLLWELLAVFGYVAALRDFRDRSVPNGLIHLMLGAWILVMVPFLFLHTQTALERICSGAAAFLLCGILLFMVYLASRKGLGGGDIKLMAASGLYLGLERVFPALLYGSLLAAVTGLLLVALKKIGMKDAIPLIPFLYVGILLSMLLR